MTSKKLFVFVAIAGVIGSGLLIADGASAHGLFGWRGGNLDNTAEDLGLTTEELKTKLETQSIGAIAQDQGQTLDDLRNSKQTRRLESLEAQGFTSDEIQTITDGRELMHAKKLEYKAEFLGLTVAELESELSTQTFKEIFEAAGKTHDDFRQFMEAKGLNFGFGHGKHGLPVH